MSEHRRKPPQPQGGGRAAARRAAQQPSGRRGASSRETVTESHSGAPGEERPYSSRAEARRAAQKGGRGRAAPSGKKRLIDYPRYGKYGWRRWVPSWKQVAALSIAFLGSLLAAGSVAYALVGVPDQNLASKSQNNVYYWDDNTPMVSAGSGPNRQNIPISRIPKAMQDAVISAENKTFRDDPGVDFKGMGRAVYNMAMGGNTQGGSTITQQFVKNALLGDQSQTLSRKFKELFISMKVGNEMEKNEILEGYLNTSYYGRGAFGIQAAARTYYGKDADDLNPSECALLATVLKGPTYYDPAGAPSLDPRATPERNYENATKRWKWILGEMVNDGKLDRSELAKYSEFPMPKQQKQNQGLGGQTGYLVDLAKAYFINNNDRGITEKELAQGGYEIHTTFNKKKVDQLTKAVKKVYDANIDPKKRPDTDTHVQFGGASVEPSTGKIVAIYGGTDATKHFTNNADQTGAQVGSTFKPFVLAAAMESGVRDPNLGPVQNSDQRTQISPDKTIYDGDNKLKIKNYDGSVWRNEEDKEWLQVNDGDKDYGPIDLRYAMQESANSPFVQLGMDVGIPQVRDAAKKAGLLESSLVGGEVPSFSIGISDPSAIRMAGAYGTFAASGEQRDPYSVTKVEASGEVVYEHDAKANRAFSSAVADNVTDVLKTVVEKGTGKNARLSDREAAGKTGTTDGNKSAWFVGYTPQLSTAIDMYRMDDNAESKNRQFLKMFGTGGQDKIHGSSFPSEIWHEYMEEALKGEEVIPFPEPEEVGEAFNGKGVSPSPTETEKSPSPSESDEKDEESPTPTESEEEPENEGPSPSNSDDICTNPFGCPDDGNNQGNQNGGPGGGGPSPSGTPTGEATEENDNGFFAGAGG
ncbi:transglycosylase domain-containing protein [Streptomyces sp. NPDC001780]